MQGGGTITSDQMRDFETLKDETDRLAAPDEAAFLGGKLDLCLEGMVMG
jgi:hypothetical protein